MDWNVVGRTYTGREQDGLGQQAHVDFKECTFDATVGIYVCWCIDRFDDQNMTYLTKV